MANKNFDYTTKIITVLLAVLSLSCLAALIAQAMGAINLNFLLIILLLAGFIGSFIILLRYENPDKKTKVKGQLTTALALLLAACLYIVAFTAPQAVLITTGCYGQDSATDNQVVERIFSEGTVADNYALYFYWYNLLHELGHCIIWFNSKTTIPMVQQEQLANDFAVAYWAYYGESDKFATFIKVVDSAWENCIPPAENDQDHLQYARENWERADFFTFNNYGWFQFSCVKKSLSNIKTLDEVLKEMGVKDIMIQAPLTLAYPQISPEKSIQILEDATRILRKWGAKIPEVYQRFSSDPNNHQIEIKRNIFGYLPKFYRQANSIQ